MTRRTNLKYRSHANITIDLGNPDHLKYWEALNRKVREIMSPNNFNPAVPDDRFKPGDKVLTEIGSCWYKGKIVAKANASRDYVVKVRDLLVGGLWTRSEDKIILRSRKGEVE